MDKEKIISLLNQDIRDEHGAIIQYLSHAYAMGEGEIACEIEGLAREEMRHLDWLARTLVKLGGVPSLLRGTMNSRSITVSEWMKDDVALEDGAITQYKKHIEQIDNFEIKRLLERILSDEESHQGDFKHFVEKTKRHGLKDNRGKEKGELIAALNWGIGHEYSVILQYLFQSYISKDEEMKKQLEDQAINEMQHMGWLAEQIIGMDSFPILERMEVDQTTDPIKMLEADIKIENKVADLYDRVGRETVDEKVKKLLFRLRDHEKYHVEVFTTLLIKLRNE